LIDDKKMSAFEESGKKSPSESRFECKKKILERTDKERFLSTKREVSDLDGMFPKMMMRCWCSRC